MDNLCTSHDIHARTDSQDDANCKKNNEGDNIYTASDCHVAQCANTTKSIKQKKPIRSKKIEILTSLKKSDERYINTLSVKAAKAAAAAAVTVINDKNNN